MPIGIGAAILGSAIIGGGFASSGQHDTNIANAEQAQANRDWQERMSNTQYQRATADMEAAGLNPMLAYSQGGAGTPSGAQATMQNPYASFGNMGSTVAEAYSSAANVDLANAQAEKARAEAEGERRRYPTYDITPQKVAQEIKESESRIGQITESIQLMGQQRETSAAQAAQMKAGTDKLRAEIPNVRQTLKLLQAQTLDTLRAAGVKELDAKKIMQYLDANLPNMQRQLGVMELNERNVDMVGREVHNAAKDSFLGAFGEYLDNLKPLSSLFGGAVGYTLGKGAAGGAAAGGERQRWSNPPKGK